MQKDRKYYRDWARKRRQLKPNYGSWLMMRNRCNNPNSEDYPYYGGRGIRVCERWDRFDAFDADMGPKQKGYTLDRIDVHGNYEPSNCRWATRKLQARNRAYVKLSEELAEQIRFLYSTGAYRQIDLAAEFLVSQGTISHILREATWA